MSYGKNSFITLTFAILFVGIFRTAKADSVYVINDTNTKQIQAYEIDGNELIYQESYSCKETEGGGAVGIAIDDSTDGQFLFVTFENGNNIELVDAKTMKYIKTVTAYGAENLSGIVVDKIRNKIYVVDRAEDNLYVYTWDAKNKSLTLDFDYPYYVELEDCQEGFGLAYDEVKDRLFVGDNTTTVKYYDPNDWSKLGEFEVLHSAVGIDVDVENQYVYTGSSQFGDNNFLCRHALNATDPCSINIKVDVKSPVLGIAVDQETSLVYLTTYGGSGEYNYPPPSTKDRLMVYAPYDPNNPEDPNMISLMWKSGDIGNPAGVSVVSSVEYKPPLIELDKQDDIEPWDEPNYVLPGDYITYTIHYSNTAAQALPGLVLTEQLPQAVDFVSAAPAADEPYGYDPNEHVYRWFIGEVGGIDPNHPGDPNSYSGSVAITVRVNDGSEPLSMIINFCAMENDASYTTATATTTVGFWGGDIIYVDADAVDGYQNGVSWENAYTDLQDALARARRGGVSEIWVAEGTYKPDLYDKTESFVMVTDVGIYGGFAGWESARNQRRVNVYETILSGEIFSAHSEIIVSAIGYVGNAVLDGFFISGGETGIYCSATANVETKIPTFSSCYISDNEGYGLHFYDYGDGRVDNCRISHNGWAGVNQDGIYCAGESYPELTSCTIDENFRYGVGIVDSYMDIDGSVIVGNGDTGIYLEYADVVVVFSAVKDNPGDGIHSHNYSSITVNNSRIVGNGRHGIYFEDDSLDVEVKNNWIHHNGNSSAGGSGIYFKDFDPIYTVMRNNTVVYNEDFGITCEDPRSLEVYNCIVGANESNLGGGSRAFYSCIWDPNISGSSIPDGDHNITADPLFGYADPAWYDFHLSADSPCIDKGDPNQDYTGETDIDGMERIYPEVAGRIDIGADENNGENVASDADFNVDGTVNLVDFSRLSRAWLSHDPCDLDFIGDPNACAHWDKRCNLFTDYVIGIRDLSVFVDNWLCSACWYNPAMAGGYAMQSSGSGSGWEVSTPKTVAFTGKPLPRELSHEQQVQAIMDMIQWLLHIYQEEEQMQKIMTPAQLADFIQKLYDSIK